MLRSSFTVLFHCLADCAAVPSLGSTPPEESEKEKEEESEKKE